MSNILDRKIAAELGGARIEPRSVFGDDPWPHLEFQLNQLSRLTAALDILFPEDVISGEGSIDRAIRILEHYKCEPR